MEIIKAFAVLILLFVLAVLYIIIPVTAFTNYLARKTDNLDYFFVAWIVCGGWVIINCIGVLIFIDYYTKYFN